MMGRLTTERVCAASAAVRRLSRTLVAPLAMLALAACGTSPNAPPTAGASDEGAVAIAAVREILKQADPSIERICTVRVVARDGANPVEEAAFDEATQRRLSALDSRISGDPNDCAADKGKAKPKNAPLLYMEGEVFAHLLEAVKSSGGFDRKMADVYEDYLERRAKGHVVAFAGFNFCGAQTLMIDFGVGAAGRPLEATETKVVGGTACAPSRPSEPAEPSAGGASAR